LDARYVVRRSATLSRRTVGVHEAGCELNGVAYVRFGSTGFSSFLVLGSNRSEPVTAHIQNLLIRPSSICGIGLHIRSTPLTISSSLTGLYTHSTPLTILSLLHVKGLTQRCYVWSNKDYKLALTLLNFQGGTKATNYRALHVQHNYYRLVTG
jgi:hypothetical protein